MYVYLHVKRLLPNLHFLYKVSNIELKKKKLLTGNVLFHKDGRTKEHDKVTIRFSHCLTNKRTDTRLQSAYTTVNNPIYPLCSNYTYTVCPRRNVPDFGRVFLMLYNPKHLYPKLNGYGDNGQRSSKL